MSRSAAVSPLTVDGEIRGRYGEVSSPPVPVQPTFCFARPRARRARPICPPTRGWAGSVGHPQPEPAVQLSPVARVGVAEQAELSARTLPPPLHARPSISVPRSITLF